MKIKKISADVLAGIITVSLLAAGAALNVSAILSSDATVGASTDPVPGDSTEPAPGDSSSHVPGETELPPEIIIGDVNGDGNVDPLDNIALSMWLAGWDENIIEEAADINGDGSVDPLDNIALARKLAGWED
ncbi:MAG: hypothetical protein J1E39_03190 [Eubacterium sp.]|nr:hypothetical protein [Eubacterium sp.]